MDKKTRTYRSSWLRGVSLLRYAQIKSSVAWENIIIDLPMDAADATIEKRNITKRLTMMLAYVLRFYYDRTLCL